MNYASDNPEQTMQNGIHPGAIQPSGRAIYEQRKLYGKQSANIEEISQYNVEHLTTFAVERKDGLLTADDGIRKLKLLDARGKIWAQEALMQVDGKAVKLFDQQSQDELEHFPLNSIQHVQAITYGAEPYAVLALIVKDIDQKIPDMHLFHCPNVPPDIVVSDIESALADCKDKKGRKIRPETLKRARERVEASVIPPPPLNPPPAPPMKEGNVRERIQSWDNIGHINDITNPGPDYNAEESSETILQRVNRDVQILNHTLDDVELFVAKLQKSAQALKELHYRKGNKKSNKSKKKMAGEGMLTLRSKLPPHQKFIDCFRKYKLAFNLLAKLKAHIQNPNAIEIIHFLFSPLQMCIQACGGYDIPRSVESPLLTKDGIDLLHNCLTTQEAEVWRNLGDFWTKSRLEFPKEHYFPPYVPTFSSGWVPPLLSNDPGKDHTELAATIAEQASRVNRAEEARRASDVNNASTDAFRQHVEQHVVRNQALNNALPTSAVMSPQKTKMCRSMFDFTGRNKNELSVAQDELLEILQDDKSWWKVRNKQGNIGYVPGNQVVVISHKATSSSSSDPPMNGGPAYTKSSPPMSPTPLPPLPPPPPPPPPFIPVAPPPPKIVPVAVTPIRRENRPPVINVNGNNNNGGLKNDPIYSQTKKPVPKSISMDKLREELKGRVNTQQAQSRNFSIPKKSASSASLKLTEKSTQTEVMRWLESRGFSQLTINSLGVLTGAQIFTLTKEEIRMVCEDDGARVYSQLQVQKSIVKDQQKGDDELAAILNMRKKLNEQALEP
ncbi:epidermal growth factor receptor kinase substrate 8-like isoform X1 [Styela clava]